MKKTPTRRHASHPCLCAAPEPLRTAVARLPGRGAAQNALTGIFHGLQGIPWHELPVTREECRRQRLSDYPHYANASEELREKYPSLKEFQKAGTHRFGAAARGAEVAVSNVRAHSQPEQHGSSWRPYQGKSASGPRGLA